MHCVDGDGIDWADGLILAYGARNSFSAAAVG